MQPRMVETPDSNAYWAATPDAVARTLGVELGGLASAAARERHRALQDVRSHRHGLKGSAVALLLKQFRSPLVLILVFGAFVSLFLREWADAGIILAIVVGSGLLGFIQEHRASRALAALQSRLALKAVALRDGRPETVAAEEIVPGDILLLSAGSLVPADGLLIEATDFLVNEASLTGESFPVEKRPGRVAAEVGVGARTNCVFAGSSVRSGTAKALVVRTGRRTEFGAIAGRLKAREPETEFARGVRRFGAMLLSVMFLIVLFVLAVNEALDRPFADSLLFAIALAVGLSPELLPAIVTVTLARGASYLAQGGVLVRRLEAIENLGSMDVLCADKTGTLTTGAIILSRVVDGEGRDCDEARRLAYLNAALETGIDNPLDAAIRASCEPRGLSVEGVRKIDEIPYDFMRRRLTIVVADADDAAMHRLISKGAVANVFDICRLDPSARARLEAYYQAQSESGFRVLAVAQKRVAARPDYTRDDETDFAFAGFLLFLDPPKPDAAGSIRDLAALGIAIKIISGDNRYVTAHVARQVGLDPAAMLTGGQLQAMSDAALWHAAPLTDLFVEIDPQQKERIVLALQHAGHAVGYLGDGINDAPALHTADVGISVDTAVDVARESADIILLRPDLAMLRRGVEDGRRTFANTLKYIGITVSANFGNMISMALVTPILPFLPLLPKQILLNNFLSDLPLAAIASDNVDRAQLARPQRWDIRGVVRFMLAFGLVSSCFDGLTFATLLLVFAADATTFQTGWFLVSLLTELGVVMILRTRAAFWGSRPGTLLARSTLAVLAATLALPYVPTVNRLLGLTPLPTTQLGAVAAIVLLYLAATEVAKRLFYRLNATR